MAKNGIQHVAIALLMGMLFVATSVCASEYSLESSKVESISMELNDAAWAKAKSISVPLDEMMYKSTTYEGMTRTVAVLQSVYDDKNIYIKVQYVDPTLSLNRNPWIKQDDGTWKKMKNPDNMGQENTYGEDKIAFFWNINTHGFEKKGCAIACHIKRDGMIEGIADKSAGRKFTRHPGEFLDTWHWKSVGSGLSTGIADDQYVDSNTDPKVDRKWGRRFDEKTGGGEKENINADKSAPQFMSKIADANRTWIMESDKVPFVDTFKVGDMIPGVVVSKLTGSRGDVEANAAWDDGKWTIVFKRALVTSSPKASEQDVQFNDLTKPYYFGIAVFDNATIDHLYHDGSIALHFK